MAAFCITKDIAEKLKNAARLGEINIERMYQMTSKERQALFHKYTDQETAQGINAGFERAMSSESQTALKSWAEQTFTGKDRQVKLSGIMQKINNLNEQGLLTPANEKAFLSDLVAEKLGATVTADEAKQIAEKSKEVTKLAGEFTRNGDPTDNPKAQIEYWQKKKELDNYLLSLTPSSGLRVLTSTFGRGMMVATLHSPVLNVESHAIDAVVANLERRIMARKVQGLNNDFAAQYRKHMTRIFNASEYDLSRFQALGGERKSMGEDYTHSQGKGAIHKLGQVTEDLVFKHLHGDIYQKFASYHFSDSANLQTTAIARAEGLTGNAAQQRALEIFKDAVSIEPTTPVGQQVRAQAEADATRETFTDKTLASQAALGLRTVLNKATGDYRAGDLVIPFAKVPANVLDAQLKASGIFLAPDVLVRMIKTLNDVHNGIPFDEAGKENFAGFYRTLIRAGLGVTFAYLLSTLINPKDFIGAYPTDPKEVQLLDLRNGVANSVRIGNKWISLDYLSILGAPLLGMLYAKKYGTKNIADLAYRYGQGVSQPIQNLPGLDQIAQIAKYLQTPPNKRDNINTAATNAGKATLGALAARIVPGIIGDIAKMTDTSDRSTDKNSVTASVQKNIPGLRQGLPIAHTLFGDAQKTEPWLSTLLFGARVKTASDGTILNELVNLNSQGELPTITDVAKSSTAAKALKQQIGDTKFNEAMTYFGMQLKQGFTDTMKGSDYQDSTPMDRKVMLDKVKAQTFKDMLDTYGYEKPEKTH